MGQKYARLFVLGHYLFLVAHSFPRALLSENCSLLGTDNVRGQISKNIFTPNGDYCLFISRALVACIGKENHATLFPWSTRLATRIMGDIAQHGGHTKANTKVMQPWFTVYIFDIWHPWSKQGIHWPVSCDHITGLRLELTCFFWRWPLMKYWFLD